MKVAVTLIGLMIYALALFYLIMGVLGFGLRIGGAMYAEEGFGLLRASYLILLLLLICGGLYYLWRLTHRLA